MGYTDPVVWLAIKSRGSIILSSVASASLFNASKVPTIALEKNKDFS